MKGNRARRGSSRWRSYAIPLVPTLVGLLLVTAGLGFHAVRPSATVPTRHSDLAPSSRSARIPNRRLLALEDQAASGVPSPLAVGGDTVPPRFREAAAPAIVFPTPAPTAIPVRTEVITYTVQPGDNVYLISLRFSISQDTVIWANDRLEMDPDLLSIGEDLAIMPMDGVWHTVKAGETLASIAQRYKVTQDDIVGYEPNGLREPVALTPGQQLIVPGGKKPFEPRLVHTSAGAAVTVNARPQPGRFVWPCNGAITQYFGTWHLGLDIGNSAGTPIYAGDAGTVTVAGWWGNLGNAVQINHGNGFITTYGHMRAVLVSQGQYVQRGQQIGEMGSTGKSTGPHVHFSVLYYGGYVNPTRYLPSP
jgi:LysM repeat protein